MRVEDVITLLPRRSIAGIMSLEGPVLRRLADHGPGRFLIKHVSHGGLGRAGIRLARVAGLLQGRQPVELSLSVLRYFFESYLEVVRVIPEECVFLLNRCPYGWKEPSDRLLCDAVMQFERELVTGLGGSLVIEETIPQGAPKCRFRLSFPLPHGNHPLPFESNL